MANYTIEDEGSLLFPSFSDEDAGQYQCTMQSSSGGYIRATHNLIIRSKHIPLFLYKVTAHLFDMGGLSLLQ